MHVLTGKSGRLHDYAEVYPASGSGSVRSHAVSGITGTVTGGNLDFCWVQETSLSAKVHFRGWPTVPACGRVGKCAKHPPSRPPFAMPTHWRPLNSFARPLASRRVLFADAQDPKIVHHAQLTLGNGMVMLSSTLLGESAVRYRWKTPAEAGGITACICVVIDDVDAHHARADAAGAEIVTAPHDNPGYPGRSYNARDLEGNNWDFGTYDPWAE
jgi:uncharacterized glyoxalase superfamily protein PhnB